MTNYVSLWRHMEAFSRIVIQNHLSHCEQNHDTIIQTSQQDGDPNGSAGQRLWWAQFLLYSPYCYPTAPVIAQHNQQSTSVKARHVTVNTTGSSFAG